VSHLHDEPRCAVDAGGQSRTGFTHRSACVGATVQEVEESPAGVRMVRSVEQPRHRVSGLVGSSTLPPGTNLLLGSMG